MEDILNSSRPRLEELTTEELQKFQSINLKSIQGLKEEIKVLKWKLGHFGSEALPHRNARQEVQGELIERLTRNIRDYAARLEQTVLLTDIVIHSVNRKVSFDDNASSVTEYTMEVSVYGRRIHLDCRVEDMMTKEENTGRKVTWFQVHFQEDIHEAIGESITQAAEQKAVHLAFSLLKSYLHWKRERDETVVSLCNSYPHCVSIYTSDTGAYCLKVASSNLDRPVFTVQWGRQTDGQKIAPDLHLQVDASDKWRELDTERVLTSAPELFDTMVTSLGLRQALDTFVQLVVSDGQAGVNV